jgi:heat shock protein HslJ
VNTTHVAMAALGALIWLSLAACGSADPIPSDRASGASPPVTRDPLDGTSWALTAYRKTRPVPGTTLTVTFEGGRVRGSAGCNAYSGTYQIRGRTIAVRDVAITERVCPTPRGIMEQERAFVGYIDDARTFRLVGGRLQVYWTDHEALTFDPQG